MERFWHLFWTNLTSWNFSLFFFHTPFITPKKQFVYKYNIANKYSDEWDNLQSQIKHYANIHQRNEWQNLISNDIINVNNPRKDQVLTNIEQIKPYDLSYEHNKRIKFEKEKLSLHDMPQQSNEIIPYE
jgi:hypothetical protein